MPIDPTLALALERAAVQPPAIIEQVQASDWASDYFSAVLPKWADAIEEDVSRRLFLMRDGLTTLWNTRAKLSDANLAVSVEHLEMLTNRSVQKLSDLLDKLEKRFVREKKRRPQLSKVKTFHDRIIAAGRREIEEKTDLILVFRAIRADRSKDATGGPSFDDPTELKNYLRRELA
jgi:hypothetical protein